MTRTIVALICVGVASTASALPGERKLKPSDFVSSYATMLEEATPGDGLAAQFDENTTLIVQLACDAVAQRLTNCRAKQMSNPAEQKVADKVGIVFERRGRLREGISGSVSLDVRMMINPG